MKLKLIAALLIILTVCSACGRKTKEELLAEGIKQLNDANPNGAVVLFKNALEKDENYLDARFQLAKAYARMGKSEQAEREYLKVLKQNPSRDEVVLELADLYNATRKGDQAFKLGEQYLSKHPGSVEGLEILGVASAANKRFEDAERYLQKALAVAPNRSKTKIAIAGVYLSTGKEQQAKSVLEELVRSDPKNLKGLYMLAALEKIDGNRDKSLEIYNRILAIDKSETLAAYKSGLILIEKGDLGTADTTADYMIKNFPKNAEGYRLKGLVYYQRKNYAEAITRLQLSLKYRPSLEGYYFLGLCYYNRGELESALSQFRKILDYAPDSRQARLMTGTILLAQKRVDDAITEIQKVLQKNDGDALAHNLLGNAYMAKGMFEEGMREYNRATKIDPKIVDAYLKKGTFYFSRGKNAEGEAELASAVKAAPDVINSRMLLASYYAKSGNAARSLSVLRAGLTGKKSDALLYNSIASVLLSQNKNDEGLNSIQKAKTVDPAFPASYQNLAIYFAATGKYDRAIEEYAALLRYDPQNVRALLGVAALYEIKGNDKEALVYYQKATDTKQAGTFLAKANYFLKKRETDKAIKVLEDALKVDSRNVAALEMKGRLLVSEKKFKEALRAFDEVEAINPNAGSALKIGAFVAMKDTAKAVELARKNIDKHPNSAQGYLTLASIYEGQRDRNRAITEVKNGLRVDANNVQAILYLGNLYESARDYTQAMALYAEASRKRPDFAPALFAQGALLDSTGKKKEAVAVYRKVLMKSESYVPALNNLAYLYASGYGSKEDALRLAVAANKLQHGNPGAMDTLGFALLRNNRPAEAKMVLEKAANLLPNNPTVQYHLALAYNASGDKNNAVKSLQKALSLGAFPDARAASTLMAELRK